MVATAPHTSAPPKYPLQAPWDAHARAAQRALLHAEAESLGRIQRAIRASTDRAVARVASLPAGDAQAAIAALHRELQPLTKSVTKAIEESRLGGKAAALKRLEGEWKDVQALAQKTGSRAPAPPRATSKLTSGDKAAASAAAHSYAAAWLQATSSAAAVGAGTIGAAVASQDHRARRIAATETARAFNDQRLAGLAVAVARYASEPWFPFLRRRWDATLDRRVCKVCDALDGMTAPLGQPFIGGQEPGSVHPLCRCVSTLTLSPYVALAAVAKPLPEAMVHEPAAKVAPPPPPEQPEPRPGDPRVFARDLARALESDPAKVRDTLRAFIRERYGLQSRDVSRGLRGAGHYEVVEPNRLGLAAASHDWDGRILIKDRGHAEAIAIARKLAAEGPEAYRAEILSGTRNIAGFNETEKALQSIENLLHEEMHGHSPMIASSYSGVGVGIEEAGTEILARKATRDLLGLSTTYDKEGAFALPRRTRPGLEHLKAYQRAQGPYDDYIGGVLRSVEKVTGDKDIYDRVEGAFIQMRRASKDVYINHESQVRAFAETITKNKKEQRALTELLLSPEGGLIR